MKKIALIAVAALLTLILTACGMSQEQIAKSLADLDNAYQTGTYEQAKSELDKLDKEYNNMSGEQKNKFGELRPLVENAVANASAIREAINKAQGFCDQKMYYEAQAELDKLGDYKLPPMEKARFDELQSYVSSSISTWNITETLQTIETLQNSGDYDLALTTINGLDISSATDEQKQQYESLKGQIDNSRLLVQAEGEYNSGNYSTASGTLSSINTAYLNNEQNQRLINLKQQIANAIAAEQRRKQEAAEAERKRQENSGVSEAKAKQIAMNYYKSMGCQSVQCYSQDNYNYYIRAFKGANYTFVIGECMVYKENGTLTPM